MNESTKPENFMQVGELDLTVLFNPSISHRMTVQISVDAPRGPNTQFMTDDGSSLKFHQQITYVNSLSKCD